LLTKAFKNNPAVENMKALLNSVGNFQIGVIIVEEVDYFPAGDTVQMMMGCRIGIKAFRSSVDLDQINQPDLGKGQESAVDGIEGNIGKLSLYQLIHCIGRRVINRIYEFAVDSHALRGNFEIEPLTFLSKLRPKIFLGFFLHAGLKKE